MHSYLRNVSKATLWQISHPEVVQRLADLQHRRTQGEDLQLRQAFALRWPSNLLLAVDLIRRHRQPHRLDRSHRPRTMTQPIALPLQNPLQERSVLDVAHLSAVGPPHQHHKPRPGMPPWGRLGTIH